MADINKHRVDALVTRINDGKVQFGDAYSKAKTLELIDDFYKCYNVRNQNYFSEKFCQHAYDTLIEMGILKEGY